MEHKQEFGHKEPLVGGDFGTTTEEDVTFFHDFVAGGVAGSASVVVGHPFDTIKVRAPVATLFMTHHIDDMVPLSSHVQQTLVTLSNHARKHGFSHCIVGFPFFLLSI
jgi:hypothetical protein